MKKLLIAGFGDVARRLVPLLAPGVELRPASRRSGFDLDRPETLAELAGWADAVLHCAPPPVQGSLDTRTAHLLEALERGRILPRRMVYVSTSGVYGDCGGAWVDESRAVNPQTERARRRVDAELRLEQWCAAHGVALSVLRAPGIYAPERLPLERLRARTPALEAGDDVYTNHIHADDLAAIALRALADDAPAGTYNASDDAPMRLGDWLDLVADRCALPRPPRVSRAQAASRIPAGLLSFMGESRRLDNRRLKQQLGVALRYPSAHHGLPPQREAA